MGLKIGIGIAIGIALLNIAFWGVVIIGYVLVTAFENIMKLIK